MLWRSFKEKFGQETKILFLFVFITCVCNFMNIHCIVFKITGIPCPTCYMTRALVSLAKGNFYLYAKYNIMALPVALVFAGELFNKAFGKYKAVLHICCTVILTINMIYYVYRIDLIPH